MTLFQNKEERLQKRYVDLLQHLGKLGAELPSDIPRLRKFEAVLPSCFTGPRPMFYYIGQATVWTGPNSHDLANNTGKYFHLLKKLTP